MIGVGNLAKWWRFSTAYGIPTYVIFDNDAGEDGDGRRRVDLLTALQVPEERFDEIMGVTQPVCGRSATVMGGNYEQSLRLLFGERYTELENEAADFLGGSGRGSKPLIARYVAERVEFDEGPSCLGSLR